MSNAVIKANADGIFARTRKASVAAGVASVIFKAFFSSCAIFCSYMIGFVKMNSVSAAVPYGYILYYALFSAGVIFSVCFFLITDYNTRRWFLENDKNKRVKFFRSVSVFVQLKIIYTKLLKTVINFLILLAYLAPSAAVLLLALNGLKKDGIDRYVFIFTAALYLFAVLLGLFFSFVAIQKYSLTDELFAINPRLSVTDAMRLSKEKTEGSCFRLARLKLSFIPWFVLSFLVFPLLFTLPYYRQTVAVTAKKLLKYKNKNASEDEQKSIVFLRLADPLPRADF